jgi:hypothetical protein
VNVDPKDFLDVPLNEKVQNSCSPVGPGIGWRGVLIRAPRQVRFKENEKIGDTGAFAAIPICSYYMVDARLDVSSEPFRLVAVNKKTHQRYYGAIFEVEPGVVEPSPPPIQRPPTREELAGTATGGYLNPNLADFVELPKVSATYEIHLEVYGYKSNVVTVELVLESKN